MNEELASAAFTDATTYADHMTGIDDEAGVCDQNPTPALLAD